MKLGGMMRLRVKFGLHGFKDWKWGRGKMVVAEDKRIYEIRTKSYFLQDGEF